MDRHQYLDECERLLELLDDDCTHRVCLNCTDKTEDGKTFQNYRMHELSTSELKYEITAMIEPFKQHQDLLNAVNIIQPTLDSRYSNNPNSISIDMT